MDNKVLMCELIPAASIPSRDNPGHLMHDEAWGPGIWQLIVSRAPGHLQTKIACLVTLHRHFRRRSE